MQKLLYHSKNSEDNESVFDKAISEICTNNAVKLVSPYIGIDYLQRITALSADWKLISDVNEWLSSSSAGDRLKIANFIKSNFEKIHHYNELHAKVVIGQDRAYLGSANLTSSGLLRRTEMGILIDDEILLQELNAWFDENWLDTAPPDLQEIAEFIQLNNEIENSLEKRVSNKIIQSKGTVIRKKPHLMENKNSTKNGEKVAENKIIQPPDMNVNSFVSNALDKLSSKDFPIIDLHLLPEFCDSEFSRNQINDELSFFTANNPRTVFSLKTINRIIYQNQKFLLSSSPLLENSIEKYDKYLAGIIKNAHFNEGFFFLKNREFIELIGISSSEDKLLINSLIESGFILDNEDGTFFLSEDFDWPSRFKLFERACSAWNDLLSQQKSEAAILTEKTLSAQLKVFVQTDSACTPASQGDANNYEDFTSELINFKREFNNLIKNKAEILDHDLPLIEKAHELFYIEVFRIINKNDDFLCQSYFFEDLINGLVARIGNKLDESKSLKSKDGKISFWGKNFFGMMLLFGNVVSKKPPFMYAVNSRSSCNNEFQYKIVLDLVNFSEYNIRKNFPKLHEFLSHLVVKNKTGICNFLENFSKEQASIEDVDKKFIDELLIFGSKFDKFFEPRKKNEPSIFLGFYYADLPVLLKAQELFYIELFKILSKEHIFLHQSSSLENLIDRVVDLIGDGGIDDPKIVDPEIVDPEYYDHRSLSFWGKKFFGMLLIGNVFENAEFCGLYKLFYVSLTYDFKGNIEYEIDFHQDFFEMEKQLPLLYKFLDDSVKSKSGSVYEYIGEAWVDYLSADAITEKIDPILVDYKKMINKNGDVNCAPAIRTVCVQIPYSFLYKVTSSGMEVTTRAEWYKCREYLESLSKQLDNTGRLSIEARKAREALKAWRDIQELSNKLRANFYAAKK